MIKHFAALKGFDTVGTSARNCFERLKRTNPEVSNALPIHCPETAPSSINVYTDGSWLNPLKQFLGLGGAGVWWPARVTLDTGNLSDGKYFLAISEAEAEMAVIEQLDNGLELFTAIG